MTSASPIAMKPYSAMDQTNGRQARGAAHSNGGLGPPAFVSALAVPDDPLDGIMQCLAGDGVEDGLAGGAWFDDFRGGSMDMSTPAGVDVLEEMLLDLPDPEPTSVLNPDGATATTPTPIGTKAAAAAATATAVVPDRPAVVTTNRWPSLSFSDRMDEDEDDDNYRMSSSSDSSSEDDAADAHWHPSESKKSSGAKRRQQKHHSAPAAERKQQTETFVRPAVPRGVVVTVEGGGGGTDRLWCRSCGTLQTPLWRAGPEGPKTLCNACGLRHKNKMAAATTTAKRLPAAKPSSAKSKKNQPGMLLAGGGSVVRKKRSVAMRIDLLNLEHEN